MTRGSIALVLLIASAVVGVRYAFAGQAPAAASDPDIPITHQDRVYSAEQYSNTVSVTDPVDNKLVGRSALVIHCRPISVHSTRDNCWCMAWGFRPITALSRLSPSVRMGDLYRYRN